MTLLAPLFFYLALGVAGAAVALHFIVTRQPASSPLPTVRFVPRSTVRVTTISRPRDLILLLVRVLIALLLGLAFARPVLVPDRRPVGRIVLADVSRSVGSIEEVRDRARALLGTRDVLIPFNTAVWVIRRSAADSASQLDRTAREAKLSSALVAALRAAAELRAEADSIEIVIVSAFRSTDVDGATDAIRALWPGRMRVVPVAARADSLAPAAGIDVRGPPEDGVAIAARLARVASHTGPHPALRAALSPGERAPAADAQVRIVRGAPSAEDSVWVASGRRTLVRWPADGAPPGWRARAEPDIVGAVVVGEAAVVYPLERRWTPDSAAATVRVAARWVDGEPAAIERAAGDGCIRDVAIPVPERGDLVLRPSFGRLVRALGEPCQTTVAGTGLDDELLLRLAGTGPLVAREAILSPDTIATPLVPWLLLAALVLALVELWVRRGSAPLGSELNDATPAREEAA